MNKEKEDEWEIIKLLNIIEAVNGSDDLCLYLCELLEDNEDLFDYCNEILEYMIPPILQQYADEEFVNILEEEISN